jgi:hypothetical protein
MLAMRALSTSLRKQLETSVLAARRASESASRAAIEGLGVFADRRPEHLDATQAHLRNGLRAKWRQFGGDRELLIAECAYEQWHRLLFARFLAENGLLLHPQYKAPVTLADCEELAAELGELDAWSVAARFAAEILPGIFRLDDPSVRLRLAPEGRHALEQILDGLPAEIFAADDALGWVYQFWQTNKKDEVNASERKIGGADLGPVTQLFTENYMVRFLLENSLGAWWAARHPDSPLVKEYDYLRFDERHPAAGSFHGWPDRVADITVMDPCCGSGHFLVIAFSMLWQMRAEEDSLNPIEAQDSVLRDNLFGLELDARCVQIAMFAVALQAWKAGSGWRELPVPNLACSGVPVRASVEHWKRLAGEDLGVENALVRLHILFRHADILGSLIDPKRTVEISDPTGLQRSLADVDWDEVAPLLVSMLEKEAKDPSSAVLGQDAAGLARAADFLSRRYTLIVTNVPYLGAQRMVNSLSSFLEQRFPMSSWDLATAFLERTIEMLAGGSVAVVSPLGWLFLRNYRALRQRMLQQCDWNVLAILGEGAFSEISGAVVKNALLVFTGCATEGHELFALDVTRATGPAGKAKALRNAQFSYVRQAELRRSPDTILAFGTASGPTLEEYATSWQGLVTGDNSRFMIRFWEIPSRGSMWEPFLTAPQRTEAYTGRSTYLRWDGGAGPLVNSSGAHNFNPPNVLANHGVIVGQSTLATTLYLGEMFNDAASPIIPTDPRLQDPIWEYLRSPAYAEAVRRINRTVKVGVGYLLKVPFDIEEWRQVAQDSGAAPGPSSEDPTQWLFDGRPEVSRWPLHVAVARLVGYQWPGQSESGDVDPVADADGIACLPSVVGEPPAAERLQHVLALAFRDSWSLDKARELLEQAGGKKKNLADWLRDEFFKQHCALFDNRPFVWHIWDGQRDGFSALVNYHRLDRKTLEKLTYTYLGQDWVERQRAAVREGVAGGDARLSAALVLQRKLEAILDGEAPFDIFVRWKETHEQPVGWQPDLNDGVRLNVRPFVQAGVLRSSFNIHWRKDRGKNLDGSERDNDNHLTLAEKMDARKEAGRM